MERSEINGVDWEAMARAILSGVGEVVIIADQRGVIRLCNAETEKQFRYAPGELTGKNIKVLMPPHEAAHHDHYIARYLAHPQSTIIGKGPRIVTAQSKDGSSIRMRISVNRVDSGEGPLFVAALSEAREEAASEALGHTAEDDPLTGLYSFHYLKSELQRVLKRVERGQEQTVAFLYLDIDHFKAVNEEVGQDEGDRVLVELAKVLLKRARKSDIAARLYSDKFGVLLYGVDGPSLHTVAESFRALAESVTVGAARRAIRVTTVIVPLRNGSPLNARLFKAAEDSCRRAKASGGARAVVLAEDR